MSEPLSDPPAEGRRVKRKRSKTEKAEKKRRRALAKLRLKLKLRRDQLRREIELTNKSAKRGKEIWESICREIKIKEFRDDMEAWGERAAFLLEKKDEKIEILMKNIAETHELHERNFVQHLAQLEYISSCYKILQEASSALYEMEAVGLVGDYINETSRLQEHLSKMEVQCENVIHCSNVGTKQRLKDNYERYVSRKFDEVCTEVEKRYIMRDNTVDKMKSLREQLLIWIKQLQGDLVDARKTEKFLYFIKRQQNYVKESENLNKIEQDSKLIMFELQRELIDIEANATKQMQSLKLERDYFLRAREFIKGSILRHKAQTHQKLLTDSSESYRVVNRLREMVKHGELLLALAACCRKYKTEKEKVLPITTEVGDPASDKNYIFNLQINIKKLMDLGEEELGEQMAYLKHFWKSCSRVRFHILSLRAAKCKLEEENENYRKIVRSLKASDDVGYISEALVVKHMVP